MIVRALPVATCAVNSASVLMRETAVVPDAPGDRAHRGSIAFATVQQQILMSASMLLKLTTRPDHRDAEDEDNCQCHRSRSSRAC